MDYLVVVGGFPLLLWALCLGNGLLVGRLAGIRLPALLLLPVGFGALIVASQFTTRSSLTAPATPWVLVALALGGLVWARHELAERWRARRGAWWWGLVAMAGTYVIVSGPLIVAGRLTFPGYLLDTTGAIQLAGAESLLQHGNNFASSVPGYGTTLLNYFGNGYPSGGHTVLSAVGSLSGQDLLWLYSPFQAVDLSLVALVLTFIARRAGLPRFAAAATGLIAAVPALVYAYALMGSIKELTALPMLLLMGALVVIASDVGRTSNPRRALPFAVAGAAALGAIGIAGSPWVVLFGIAVVVSGAVPILYRRDLLGLLAAGVVLAIATALLALPTVGPLSKTLALAKGVSSSNARAVADPGNLLRPLKFVQSLGVWLGQSHRVEPQFVNLTYLLIGVVALCGVLGLIWLARRRAWGILAFVGISIAVWAILTHHGTEWTDAKLLVLLSPVMMFCALVGAFGRIGSRTLEGVLLAVVVAGSVLASDALVYHGTNMAPTQRYSELREIGVKFAGQGPTLAPDFDEYVLYLLRDMRVDSPGLAYQGPLLLVNGTAPAYGHSYDLDALSAVSVERFPLIVARRSPERSRPPSNYTVVWRGRYYLVWRRTGPAPVTRLGLGTPDYQAASVASCSRLRGLAREANRIGGKLAFAPRPSNVVVNLATAGHSPSVVQITDLEGRPELGYNGPGRIETGVQVHAGGKYELWLGGDIDSRSIHVLVDGRLVGAPAMQSGDDGNVIYVTTLDLKPGHHTIDLVRGGGGLQPGNNAGTVIDGIVLAPLGSERGSVQTIRPDAWHSLCGRTLDWVEVVGSA